MQFSGLNVKSICSKTDVKDLFEKGRSKIIFPLKYYFLSSNDNNAFLVSVPKRNFKRATDRNRIKRIMRECLRVAIKENVPSVDNSKFHIGLIYIGKALPKSSEIDQKIILILQRIAQENKPEAVDNNNALE